jgi:hypothetical protein
MENKKFTRCGFPLRKKLLKKDAALVKLLLLQIESLTEVTVAGVKPITSGTTIKSVTSTKQE